MTAKTRRKTKKPNAVERAALAIVLKEMRRAMRLRRQKTITIEPWNRGGGVHIIVEFGDVHTIDSTGLPL